MVKKVYAIDIDGTICRTPGGIDYPKSKPITKAIEAINKLYDEGHTIKMFTGRGCVSGIDWRDFTEKQLKGWGLKYHELIMNKPYYDHIIDDRATNADEWRATLC